MMGAKAPIIFSEKTCDDRLTLLLHVLVSSRNRRMVGVSKKLYVVLERSYEYNDETYDASEGGNAVIAFNSKDAAEKEAVKRTADFLRGTNVDTIYNWGDIFNNTANAVLGKRGISRNDLDDHEEFEKLVGYTGSTDDADIVVLASALKNPVFFVESIDLGDDQ